MSKRLLKQKPSGESAGFHPESWPQRSGRARVLVESPHDDYRSEHALVLETAGYDVAVCSGPTHSAQEGPGCGCPLVVEGRCALVDGADVVISSTRLTDGRDIVEHLTARSSAVVVVEGAAPDLERDRDVLRDARLLPLPVNTHDLLRAVEDAVGGAGDRSELKYWEDFAVGEVTVHGMYRLEKDEIVEFARFFDPQFLHVDEAAASRGPFGGLIASGIHTFALCGRLITRSETVRVAALGSPGVDELRWLLPVRAGDELTARSRVLEVRPLASDPARGSVLEEHELLNQDDEVVLRFRSTVFVARRGSSPAAPA